MYNLICCCFHSVDDGHYDVFGCFCFVSMLHVALVVVTEVSFFSQLRELVVVIPRRSRSMAFDVPNFMRKS